MSQIESFLTPYFEGSIKYEYDERIDEVPWMIYFSAGLLFFTTIHVLLRKFAPPPGPIEQFKK